MDLYSAERLTSAQAAMAADGLDAIVVTPGGDLRYLTGYDAMALERLTCLVLPAAGEATLIVPKLERPAAEASPVAGLGTRIVDYPDGVRPHPLVAQALAGATRGVLGLSDRMWAAHVLALRETLPGWEQRLAAGVLAGLRVRKSPAEVAALRRAGAAIDRVHARMGEWLRPGRTEAEVAADIALGIREAGHATVDFTIVASGPNGASPHHEVSDRVLETGDVVVVDIGGPLPEGYHSDSTRTYVVGEPGGEVRDVYAVLQRAQAAAVDAVRPGVTAASIDEAARAIIRDAGYGEYFVHRTGHGIGLEVHEEPYIVDGNDLLLEPGMAFSIEPGIYFPGRWGARIEDIVVVTGDGCEAVNRRPHDLLSC